MWAAMWTQLWRMHLAAAGVRDETYPWRQNDAPISVSLSEIDDSRGQPRTLDKSCHFGRLASRDGKGAPALYACDPHAHPAPPANRSTVSRCTVAAPARGPIPARVLQRREQARLLGQADRHLARGRPSRLSHVPRGGSEPGTQRQRTRLSSGADCCGKLQANLHRMRDKLEAKCTAAAKQSAAG
jgi:hypothetical protein